MRIRMLVDMPEGSTRNGEPWPSKGDSADLPTAEAAHLVASGVAEEAAAEPRGRRRKGADSEGEAT
ncbi:hypothetical protein ACIQ6Y_15280 [Streptomyces sp. NPDC096205]|uniref:hypothetical protein n=1 Tax=Streptomyces sp. NPDC096205 TaxID=3366081 RepID=UPI00380DDA8F